MDSVRQIVSDASARAKLMYNKFDADTLLLSISSSFRKTSKALIFVVILAFSFVLLISFPSNQSALANLEHHQENETLSHEDESQQTPNITQPVVLDEDVFDEGQSYRFKAAEEQPRDRRFALVIPATSASPDLCKTIMTALALGYPSPVIINWNTDYHAITKWSGGRNLPKIPGFVKYLDAVLRHDADPTEKLRDDDLVLMVDAYDVWFQLPAEILLRRYHDINKEANLRLRRQWPGKNPMLMHQTIIAASGKNCHPQPESGSNLHCDRIPDSPLRADLYGAETEKNETKHRDHRPKYINGGVYIGPAGDMRRLFRRALEKMESGIGQGVHLFSEQGIPGEVLGEQEIWRQWRRDADVPNDSAMALMNRDFEYHFGLDYNQTLSIQTFWTNTDNGLFDGAFVTLDNQTAIKNHSESLGISPVRLKGVPDDIKKAQNPLDGVIGEPNWGNMSLYADFFTEAVPAILHHNGFKERRTAWWDKPWFHQRLRQLLRIRLTPIDPATPLATVEVSGGSVKYFAPLSESSDRKPRRMADTASKRFPKMEFQEVCHYPKEVPNGPGMHWWDEVFRDGKGPVR